MSVEQAGAAEREELERVRNENETLSGVVGVVTSSPDLAHILDRVVDLLTRATSSHACFVYLVSGDRLRLRAASPIYSHLVGRISFGVDEGLAGWSMQRGRPAFIREGAMADPRTVFVPELEEERFQSMVAVPIPARAGESIGAIVLHTVAPREFDEGILNVLTRAASLVSGAIENARLYEHSRERVEALTRLAELGRKILSVGERDALYRVAAKGIRELLGADVGCLYEYDAAGEPVLVAVSPASAASSARREDELAAELTVEGERWGVLTAAGRDPWAEAGPELIRAAAHQVALALEKVGLIARLRQENLARDLFEALAAGELDTAATVARGAGIELERPYVLLEARPLEEEGRMPWVERGAAIEAALHRLLPGSVCDLGATALRCLAPSGSEGVDAARRIAAEIGPLAAEQSLAIGVGESRRGARAGGAGLREADDAATVAAALGGRANVLLYRDTGAYRYLIGQLAGGGPDDHLREAVERVAEYDRRRRSQLLQTLDEYLAQGRGVAVTARALTIHVNTLRQRLERIETLTGMRLADEDLLALQLAVKLGRVRDVA